MAKTKRIFLKPPPRFHQTVTEPTFNYFDWVRQRFFRVKLLFFLILCLRYPISRLDQEWGKLEKYYEMDVEFCPDCFPTRTQTCFFLTDNFRFVFYDLADVINALLGVKPVHVGRLPGLPRKLVAKYSGKQSVFNEIKNEIGSTKSTEELETKLHDYFVSEDRIGFHVCPDSNVNSFVDRLTKYTSSRIETWMHLLVDAETILFADLNNHLNISAPRYLFHCGFTIYESYEGLTLSEWQDQEISYMHKVRMSYQLLLAATRLSDGYDDYRIYLTDLTLDNIVYNEETRRLSFLDFDSVIIVDTNLNRTGQMVNEPPPTWEYVNKYERFYCKNCFPYDKKKLCEHHQSDINMFSVCQLLNENLFGDERRGFLKPIPIYVQAHFPLLQLLLYRCIYCDESSCKNRFPASIELNNYLHRIILFLAENNPYLH